MSVPAILSAALWAFIITSLWAACIFGIGSSPKFITNGYVLVTLVLGGMTAASHRLFRRHDYGWFLAATLAPIIAVSGIAIAFAIDWMELLY